MNLSFNIAKRYFLSKKKKNFINIISIISMLAVCFGTMALVTALSVFNGLEDLLRSIHSSFDPELKVMLLKGKSFETNTEFTRKLKNTPGVEHVSEVIEDNVYVKYKNAEMVVTLKGVSSNYQQQNQLSEHIVIGDSELNRDGVNYALIGRGVQFTLGISPINELQLLQVYYPRKSRSINLDPSRLITVKHILPGGIFALEKQYDENYIIVPLEFARELMDYGARRTSFELKTDPASTIEEVQQNLKATLGPDFQVLNTEEQHSDVLKVIRIEKLFVFLIFSFILIISSFNIFFSLTMLIIEKKKDVAILFALGASRGLIRSIFLKEGGIIAFLGALLGLSLGFLICWTQQTFGLISMGMETSILQAYPVKIQLSDFLLTGITIVVITFLATIRPAISASNSDTITQL